MESLWKIIHQKPYVLASRLISMGMARGLSCENMEKPMNWVVYAEWTNGKQQRLKQKVEQVELMSSYEGKDDNEPLDGGGENDCHDGMLNVSKGLMFFNSFEVLKL
jgi:hypothetical protein